MLTCLFFVNSRPVFITVTANTRHPHVQVSRVDCILSWLWVWIGEFERSTTRQLASWQRAASAFPILFLNQALTLLVHVRM